MTADAETDPRPGPRTDPDDVLPRPLVLPGSGYLRRRPRGLVAVIFSLPALGYRLGLGRLLGLRFVIISHVGRRSGRRYDTAVDIIGLRSGGDEVIVVSAWGEEADWIKNIRKQPPVEIAHGDRRFVPEVRELDEAERLDVLLRYDKKHPLEMKAMAWLFGWDWLDGSVSSWERFVAEYPMFGLRPQR